MVNNNIDLEHITRDMVRWLNQQRTALSNTSGWTPAIQQVLENQMVQVYKHGGVAIWSPEISNELAEKYTGIYYLSYKCGLWAYDPQKNVRFNLSRVKQLKRNDPRGISDVALSAIVLATAIATINFFVLYAFRETFLKTLPPTEMYEFVSLEGFSENPELTDKTFYLLLSTSEVKAHKKIFNIWFHQCGNR